MILWRVTANTAETEIKEQKRLLQECQDRNNKNADKDKAIIDRMVEQSLTEKRKEIIDPKIDSLKPL